MTRPTPSRQPRNHGLAPRFRYGYTAQHVRVSDAERTEMADRLAAHFGEGRLKRAEFDERVAQAMSARTRGDLSGLFDDLPEPGPRQNSLLSRSMSRVCSQLLVGGGFAEA